MNDMEKARQFLKATFPHSEQTTKYIASYATARGRNIALERERQDQFHVWVETYDHSIEGVTVNNRRSPGLPYGKDQSRNSNLNNKTAPRLKVGNSVWYLKIRDFTTFQEFVRWYATV